MTIKKERPLNFHQKTIVEKSRLRFVAGLKSHGIKVEDPPRQRNHNRERNQRIIELYNYKGKSGETNTESTIAKKMNVTVGTVVGVIHRARKNTPSLVTRPKDELKAFKGSRRKI